MKYFIFLLVLLHSIPSFSKLLREASAAMCSGQIESGKALLREHLQKYPLDYEAHFLVHFFTPTDIKNSVPQILKKYDKGEKPQNKISRLDLAHSILIGREKDFITAKRIIDFIPDSSSQRTHQNYIRYYVSSLLGEHDAALKYLKNSYYFSHEMFSLLLPFVFEEDHTIEKMKIKELLRQNISRSKNEYPELQLGKSLLAYFNGLKSLDELASTLGQSYSSCPLNPWYTIWYAEILISIDQYSEARSILQKFLEKDPFPSPYTLELFGVSLFHLNQYKEAEIAFKQALSPKTHKIESQNRENIQRYLDKIKQRPKNNNMLWILSATIFVIVSYTAWYTFKTKT